VAAGGGGGGGGGGGERAAAPCRPCACHRRCCRQWQRGTAWRQWPQRRRPCGHPAADRRVAAAAAAAAHPVGAPTAGGGAAGDGRRRRRRRRCGCGGGQPRQKRGRCVGGRVASAAGLGQARRGGGRPLAHTRRPHARGCRAVVCDGVSPLGRGRRRVLLAVNVLGWHAPRLIFARCSFSFRDLDAAESKGPRRLLRTHTSCT